MRDVDGRELEPIEIACDESGSEGENLVGGNTDVFAHASVQLTAETATHHIQEIRERIRSPATEYKANHLLRQKHRSVLEWLLEPSGPIYGKAHVHLIDKAFFVVARVVELLVGDVTDAATVSMCRDEQAKAIAITLYRDGQRTFGNQKWQAFLESSNNLLRARSHLGATTPVDSFFGMVDVLRMAGAPGRIDEIMERLQQARPRADDFRLRVLDNPRTVPTLDPLIPALFQTVVHWTAGGQSISVVHDEQSALTEERIAKLEEMFSKPQPDLCRDSPGGRLVSLRRVDSRFDARVQLADFLAGVARKIASDELNDHGDATLTGLLRPFVDSCSIWADDRSWSLLGPAPDLQP